MRPRQQSPLTVPCYGLHSNRAYAVGMDSPKLVVASICASRPEADLARGELESAGIPAMVQADTAGGMREHLAWSGTGFKILGREEDIVAACDLLTPSPGSQLKEDEEIPEHEHQGDY
jgi:hypothetical protein